MPIPRTLNEYRRRNQQRWNELVPIHVGSSFYDVAGFRAGRVALCPIELEELGDPSGQSILHLQCHFGLGTLTLARMGARVTGVDYSEAAIEQARRLSAEIDIAAEFVCADVYDLPSVLAGQFQIAFASYGVLIWLHDLRTWAKVVAHFIAPGGFFYLVDEHPFALVCRGEGNTESLRLAYAYMDAGEPVAYEIQGSYADRQASVKQREVFNWLHSLSSLVNALIEAGLVIEYLHEYPYSVYAMFPGMTADAQGRWTLPGPPALPYLFSIKARKPLA
jgi:SAM-dependent methyltransferase